MDIADILSTPMKGSMVFVRAGYAVGPADPGRPAARATVPTPTITVARAAAGLAAAPAHLRFRLGSGDGRPGPRPGAGPGGCLGLTLPSPASLGPASKSVSFDLLWASPRPTVTTTVILPAPFKFPPLPSALDPPGAPGRGGPGALILELVPHGPGRAILYGPG
jgi:hypothetical protein